MTTPPRPSCSAVDRYSRDDARRCTNPATHRVILGCVHEHMMCGFSCSTHMVAVRAGALIPCAYCSEGPAPHECPTLGREATREEQQLVVLARTNAGQRPGRDETEENP